MSRGLTYNNVLVTGGLFVGFGYALMKYSTPTEEEFYMKLPPGFRKESYNNNDDRNDNNGDEGNESDNNSNDDSDDSDDNNNGDGDNVNNNNKRQNEHDYRLPTQNNNTLDNVNNNDDKNDRFPTCPLNERDWTIQNSRYVHEFKKIVLEEIKRNDMNLIKFIEYISNKHQKYGDANGLELCLKNQIQRGIPYGALKGCYELKKDSVETLNGLGSLNRPGLSFSNPYKDEFTDEDLYPALMDPTSCTIHCGDFFFKYAALKKGNECYCGNDTIESSYNQINDTLCNKTCSGCLSYNCTTDDKWCGGETVYTVYDVKIEDSKVPSNGGNVDILEKLDIISNLKNSSNLRYEPRFLNYSVETLNGLGSLNRPGLSFSNPYKDEFTDEDLYPALMDPTSCTIHCGDFFFKYAALKKGNECYCGNDTIESSYNQINDTLCNKTCSGCLSYNCTTDDKWCGGETVYTVYDVKIEDSKVPSNGGNVDILEKLDIISNLKNSSNLRYEPRFLNCIKDSSICYRRILNSTEVYETGVDTIDKCIAYCNSKGIFGYAGLEAGSQCFCGNNFTSKDINLSLEHCSSSCTGNRSQICGGFFALSVYNASKVVEDTKSEGDNSTGLSKIKIIGITIGSVVGGTIVFGGVFYGAHYICCHKQGGRRGVPYDTLKGYYKLKEDSNETLNGLRPPSLSFYNPYKDEYTDEDLYPALMDPTSYGIDGTFCNKTCAGCLGYNCTANGKRGGETVYTVYDVKIPDDKMPSNGGKYKHRRKLDIVVKDTKSEGDNSTGLSRTKIIGITVRSVVGGTIVIGGVFYGAYHICCDKQKGKGKFFVDGCRVGATAVFFGNMFTKLLKEIPGVIPSLFI
ncbi:hypothetical protein Glove_172g18 [Diversispora epigaea]|uniref:WSC domain-containing protein n=1 Tax=Diversispora epigaea TaxID=1348612 RepID=A0A397IS94_9GLOM|nr:hypothetical protein Glove_172g18 [Diversispora epigaea]